MIVIFFEDHSIIHVFPTTIQFFKLQDGSRVTYPWWFLARMKRRVRMIKNTLKKHGRQTGRNFTDIWWHLYYEYFVICDLIRKHHVSLQLYSWIPSHNWLRATLFSENHCSWCKTTGKTRKQSISSSTYVFSVSLHFKVKKRCLPSGKLT